MCKLGDYCLKWILYWFGSGLELLSACLEAELCRASKGFLMQNEPLSMKHSGSLNNWEESAAFVMTSTNG